MGYVGWIILPQWWLLQLGDSPCTISAWFLLQPGPLWALQRADSAPPFERTPTLVALAVQPAVRAGKFVAERIPIRSKTASRPVFTLEIPVIAAAELYVVERAECAAFAAIWCPTEPALYRWCNPLNLWPLRLKMKRTRKWTMSALHNPTTWGLPKNQKTRYIIKWNMLASVRSFLLVNGNQKVLTAVSSFLFSVLHTFDVQIKDVNGPGFFYIYQNHF